MPEEPPFGVSWMETGMRHPWPTHAVHTDGLGLMCYGQGERGVTPGGLVQMRVGMEVVGRRAHLPRT